MAATTAASVGFGGVCENTAAAPCGSSARMRSRMPARTSPGVGHQERPADADVLQRLRQGVDDAAAELDLRQVLDSGDSAGCSRGSGGQPLWRVLASLSPEEIVRQIDFTYIDDAITPADALAILERSAGGRAERMAMLESEGLPAYTTSAGWLGYDDDKVADSSASRSPTDSRCSS